MGCLFSEIYLLDYISWNLKTMWWAKWKLSFPGSKTWPAKFTQLFYWFHLIMLCSPRDFLRVICKRIFFMARYWSWIAQWLEHQHIKLETWVQAPVQDRIFPFQLHKISIFKVSGRVNISGHWRPQRMMSDDDNDGQMIFGDLGGLKLPGICLTGEEKPRKNLTQETSPDQGSNPGPLQFHNRIFITCIRYFVLLIVQVALFLFTAFPSWWG